MESERLVAGVRCSEVLADLSDYFDDALAPERRRQLEAHVGGCDVCERFGREFADAISALRRHLGPPAPLDAGIAARLRERLKKESG
jgi:anti-sigma factor RsiW